MARYRVTAWADDWMVEVEADDEDDAIDKAHIQLAIDAEQRLSSATWDTVRVDD